jgi:hypothetical protein
MRRPLARSKYQNDSAVCKDWNQGIDIPVSCVPRLLNIRTALIHSSANSLHPLK